MIFPLSWPKMTAAGKDCVKFNPDPSQDLRKHGGEGMLSVTEPGPGEAPS